MKEIIIRERETLSDRKYQLEEIKLEIDGKSQKREVYHRSDAVSVLLIDFKQKQLLLTRQFRLPVYLKDYADGLVEACAGVIDDGEDVHETVLREVKEETGFTAENIKQVAVVYTSPASLTERIYLFTAEIDVNNKTWEGGGLVEEGEDIEPVVISFTDVGSMLRGGIRDIKTLALMQHFYIHYILNEKL